MTAPERRTKAAARAATREAILRAAAQMLLESPTDPIGQLRPVEIVRRADPPRTNGAFYNIWPTREDFRADLLRYVLSIDRIAVGPPTTRAGQGHVGAADFDLTDTVRVLANLNFDGIADDPTAALRLAFWSRHAVDPPAAALLAGLYRDVATMMTPMYAAILERSGRRLRPPWTLDLLSASIVALGEGLTIRRGVDPAAVPDDLYAAGDDDGRWTLFAALTNILLLGVTEPVDG